MDSAERLAVMSGLESHSGGQLSKFFTAQGYGVAYDASRLRYSSKAAKIAAALQAAERDGRTEDVLLAACLHFGIEHETQPPQPVRRPGDQARQVRAWVDLLDTPPVLQVVNNSDAPIRAIVPSLTVESGSAMFGGGPFWNSALAELPPFSAFAWSVSHMAGQAKDSSASTNLHVEFDDASGQRWQLGHDRIVDIAPNTMALRYVELIEAPQTIDDLVLPSSVAAEAAPSSERLVFLSYVGEDALLVDRLDEYLTSHGISVWRDRDSLLPGDNWKTTIRQMITDGCFAFVACFSETSVAKPKSYMNEELSLALDELRLRNTTNWFLPVMLTDCTLPDVDIGLNGRLTDIQQCRLYLDWDRQAERLRTSIRRLA